MALATIWETDAQVKFYAHRKRPQKIWPSESEKQLLEGHLKIGISAKTESMDAIKWTVALLKQ